MSVLPQPSCVGAPSLAEVAALVADPGRANMLAALMDGRALTATELAYIARIAPATASGHLAKLLDGRMLVVERQGRHRYYRLSTPLVGRLMESLLAVAADGPPRHRPPSRIDAVMREARTCYDHLAGRVAVAVTDALVARDHLVLADGGGEITESGVDFLRGAIGLDLTPPSRGGRRRPFCRPCLDWSERRSHLAGAVGAALCGHCLERAWVRRLRDTRALEITPQGREAFQSHFGVEFSQPARALSA